MHFDAIRCMLSVNYKTHITLPHTNYVMGKYTAATFPFCSLHSFVFFFLSLQNSFYHFFHESVERFGKFRFLISIILFNLYLCGVWCERKYVLLLEKKHKNEMVVAFNNEN